MKEDELIQKFRQNDDAALSEIVSLYQSMVINICFGFVGKDEAEDVAQEVFISVWRNLKDFKKDSTLKTWIYRIAVNTSLNHLRKQKFNSLLESIDMALSLGQVTSGPEEEFRKKEEKNYVRLAIRSLPRNQRIAVTLQNSRNLSYREIADIMGKSVSTVESLLFRAKSNLRKKLVKFYFSNL